MPTCVPLNGGPLCAAGLTKQGLERKATVNALFSKLLYLVECERLFGPGTSAARDSVDLPKACRRPDKCQLISGCASCKRTPALLCQIFEATEEDVEELRIVSLYDVNVDLLDRMVR